MRCASRCSPAGTPGNDLKLSLSRVEANRNFANKIWNAARFVVMRLEDDAQEVDRSDPNSPTYALPPAAELSLPDRWILSRYASVRDDVTRLIESWQLGEAGRQLYEFLWNEYCDWYIEAAKVRLGEGTPAEAQATRQVLAYVLERSLRLLHPFMPFVTEAIWRNLPGMGGRGAASIMVTRWPEELTRLDAAAETALAACRRWCAPSATCAASTTCPRAPHRRADQRRRVRPAHAGRACR
jgi:valyl-tRNA synthetase